MFTGIIEAMGEVLELRPEKTNLHLKIAVPFSHELRVDQSIAHNGCCLTVTETGDGFYWVTAVDETLKRSNIGQLKPGSKVNLERCLKVSDRFEGHIVQGHVDGLGICSGIDDQNGSWKFHFVYESSDPGNITVPKGSITVNGTSLTVVDSGEENFSVVVIPYTMEHTLFGTMQIGDAVNLEFDIVGKYIARIRQHQ